MGVSIRPAKTSFFSQSFEDFLKKGGKLPYGMKDVLRVFYADQTDENKNSVYCFLGENKYGELGKDIIRDETTDKINYVFYLNISGLRALVYLRRYDDSGLYRTLKFKALRGYSVIESLQYTEDLWSIGRPSDVSNYLITDYGWTSDIIKFTNKNNKEIKNRQKIFFLSDKGFLIVGESESMFTQRGESVFTQKGKERYDEKFRNKILAIIENNQLDKLVDYWYDESEGQSKKE